VGSLSRIARGEFAWALTPAGIDGEALAADL